MLFRSVGMLVALDTTATLSSPSTDQQMQIGSLAESRDWALAFGTGFALAGACLAVGGAIAMAQLPRSDTPRLHFAIVSDGTTSWTTFGGHF